MRILDNVPHIRDEILQDYRDALESGCNHEQAAHMASYNVRRYSVDYVLPALSLCRQELQKAVAGA